MSDEFDRYAVYWVPRRPDPLAPFGAAWTGWCAERGEPRPRGAWPGLGVDVAAVTADLHRHGLHGVIRAPFRLAPGRSLFALEHLLDGLAEDIVAFRLPRLELAVVDGRVALVPAQSCGALAALVTRVVDTLGALVAPSPAGNGFAEAAPATPRLDGTSGLVPLRAAAAHRFHVPLTDPLPLGRAHALKAALAPLVGPMLTVPRALGDIALMGDPGEGRPLRVLQHYELRDWPARPGAAALPCHGRQVLAPMPELGRQEADLAV
jgi:hypothetical protein